MKEWERNCFCVEESFYCIHGQNYKSLGNSGLISGSKVTVKDSTDYFIPEDKLNPSSMKETIESSKDQHQLFWIKDYIGMLCQVEGFPPQYCM
ncbi:hypothetical protein OUZ56_005474 [Daphnia magna]|uniref:Uncharacterized protein n=1 Tax=Daphnia magna TaxID=35525 RepID=A0ABQ9YSW3_9CRUS|nr:hypothetical protein OUZ56_005474 [Daphnia magna]